MILKYSVGLDISGKDIKACISTIDGAQNVKVKSTTTISNSKTGFECLEQWIGKHYKAQDLPMVMCMEATGIYHENCAYYFFKKQYRVSIVVPNKAKKYMQSLGLKSKNDSIDAKGLAQMGAEQALKAWEPMDTYFYQLRNLTRQYQNLQEQVTATSNQLHAEELGMHVDKMVIRHLKARIALFDKQANETLQAIKAHIVSDSQTAARIENICRIKGLGILSVATVLAETNGFALFENYKQVVSYAGYDVVENQSGKHQGKTRISKKGNARIRRILFMPAFTAVTHKEPQLLSLYQRTFARHGIKMKSYVAVQKKLLLMIYYLWQKNAAYDSLHINAIQEQEQEPSSGTNPPGVKKLASNKVEAKQGRHPANNRSLPPLGKTKIGTPEKLFGV